MGSSRKPSGRFLCFPSSTSSNVFFMVSVVGFVYGFRRGKERFLWFPSLVFCMFSVVAGKRCLWFPSLDVWWILPPQEDPKFQNVSSDSSFRVLLGLVSVAGVFMVSVVGCFYGFRRGKEGLLMVSVVVFVHGFRLLQDRGCLSDGNRKKKSGRFRDELSIYVYIYIYIYTYSLFFIPRGILWRRVAGFESAFLQRPVGPRPVKKGRWAEGRWGLGIEWCPTLEVISRPYPL